MKNLIKAQIAILGSLLLALVVAACGGGSSSAGGGGGGGGTVVSGTVNGGGAASIQYQQRNYYHMAAARHNVQGGEPPSLERSVYYDDLAPKSIQVLAELSEREGMKALKTLNRRARELQKRDRGSAEARYRMNFGIYFFDLEELPEKSASDSEPDKD